MFPQRRLFKTKGRHQEAIKLLCCEKVFAPSYFLSHIFHIIRYILILDNDHSSKCKMQFLNVTLLMGKSNEPSSVFGWKLCEVLRGRTSPFNFGRIFCGLTRQKQNLCEVCGTQTSGIKVTQHFRKGTSEDSQPPLDVWFFLIAFWGWEHGMS